MLLEKKYITFPGNSFIAQPKLREVKVKRCFAPKKKLKNLVGERVRSNNLPEMTNKEQKQEGRYKKDDIYGRKNIISILIGFPLFVIAGVFGKMLFTPNSSNESLESVLQSTSTEINKELPKKIDETTQLTTTAINGTDIIYKYTITADRKLTQNDLDTSLMSKITNQACTIPETKRLLDQGAGMKYMYTNDDGNYIGAIAVRRSDCE